MKESYYYSLLKSTADKEILNMPLEALGLKSSVLEELRRIKKVSMGENKCLISTIGDLINYGYDELISYFSITKPAYDDLREKVYHIEEKLAKLGLKLKDSDFSIGDVRVTELSKDCQDTINKFGKRHKTLDDVIIFRYGRMAQVAGFKSAELNNLESELSKYGLKIEGSPTPLDKSLAFPLRPYMRFLTYEYLLSKGIDTTKKEKIRKPKEKLVDLSKFSKEEKMELEIKHLGLQGKQISALNDLEIYTIGDLVEYGEQELREQMSIDKVRTFQKRLAAANLEMDGSTVKLEDGKIILAKRGATGAKNGLMPNAPKPFDASVLEGEEREKFLSIQIHEFGFADAIVRSFENTTVKTIGDLVSLSRCDIDKYTNNYVHCMLKTALNQYNLKLQPKIQRRLRGSMYFDPSKINPAKMFNEMSEQEKSQLLSTKLFDAGFKEVIVDLFSKFDPPVETLGGMIEKSCADIKNIGGTDSQLGSIRGVLHKYGLMLKKSAYRSNINFKRGRKSSRVVAENSKPSMYRSRTDIVLKPVESMTTEERETFMSQPLEMIGFTPFMAQKFKENGIETIAGLLECSPTYLIREKKLIGPNPLSRIQKNLEKCGLRLKNRADKRSQMKEMIKKKLEADRVETAKHQPSKQNKQPSSKNKPVVENDMKNVKILQDSDILALGITPVVLKKLRNGGINTVGQLTSKGYKDLLNIGLNTVNISQVQKKLKYHGLSLMLMINRNFSTISKQTLLRGEELMKSDIKVLYLTKSTEEKLRKINVNTVEELTAKSFSDLSRNGLYAYHIKQVQESLQKVDLKLAFARPLKVTSEKTTHYQIPTETGDQLLALPVSRLRFTKALVQKLGDMGVFTIGDLISKSNSDFIKNGITYTKVIKTELQGVGLEMYRERARKGEREELKPKYQTPTETGDELLALPIERLGLTQLYNQKLQAIGISTIGDLTRFTNAQLIKNGINCTKGIREKLSDVGLSIKVANTARSARDFKQTELRGEELLASDITVVGITPVIVEKLRAIGVNTIGELLQKSSKDLCKSNFNCNNVIRINKQLSQVGLHLPKLKDKGSANNIISNMISDNQPIKHKTRKEQVEEEFVMFDSENVQKSDNERETNNENKIVPNNNKTSLYGMRNISNPEFMTAISTLENGLQEKGIWALYDMDCKYFGSCTLELEEIKEVIREYFDTQFNKLIFAATSEEMLSMNEQKIKKESNIFESIIEQKQLELTNNAGALEKKKTLSASALRQKIFDKINKYYHKEFEPVFSVDDKNENF